MEQIRLMNKSGGIIYKGDIVKILSKQTRTCTKVYENGLGDPDIVGTAHLDSYPNNWCIINIINTVYWEKIKEKPDIETTQNTRVVKGPTGPIGPAGPKGNDSEIPGPKGPTGSVGKDSIIPGPRGATGASIKGPTGPRGPTGAGTKGATGGKGITGGIGPTGPIGSPTYKSGIATKNINDASTTQNIAHGLGRIPKIVRVKCMAVASALSQICLGVYDGTNHSGISICMTEGTTTATTDTIYSSATQELGFTAAGSTSPFSGANKQSGVITVDATNIIITWTKTGTVASNTVNILWEVS
jgi:hypothetical protein